MGLHLWGMEQDGEEIPAPTSINEIHLGSGDIDGTHPERHVNVNQKNYKQLIHDLRDTMVQAAVWYEANIIHNQ